MQFPLTMTFAELAALPQAAEEFSWDPSMIEPDDDDTTLAGHISSYGGVYASSTRLYHYLNAVGYTVSDVGVSVRDENALRLAHALFCCVTSEYDGGDASPTWTLFGLGGDDDVDYCGTQPSCLTSLLIRNL